MIPYTTDVFSAYAIQYTSIEKKNISIETQKLYTFPRNIDCVNHINTKLKKFKYLFYLLKMKKNFRDWLWIRVREKRARMMLQPKKIQRLLRNGSTFDELEDLIQL